MSDEPTIDDTAEIPTPPSPGGPAALLRLRRSNSDRMIAGVCGGTAEYLGIDPILVRLAFVVLAVIGGSGLAIYLIAWLVMPSAWEDESAALNALRGGRRAGGRSLLALALLILAIVIFSGSVLWLPIGDGLFLPLLILAAGVALLVWPADAPAWAGRWHMDNEEWRAERDAIRSGWRTEREAWRQSRREWRHGYRRGYPADTGPPDTGPAGNEPGTPTPPGTAMPWPPSPPPPVPFDHPPRPRPFLGPLAAALLLLFSGLSVLADRLGWWSIDPASFLSICLVILGAVLLVSAFVGRARGLVWLGVLLVPIAWATAAVDITWWDGIGQQQFVVTSVDDLDAEYRWGIGELQIDLSDLDLDGETREVAVGLSIGELKIWVPESLGADIDLDARAGSIIVSEGDLRQNDDGVDASLDREAGDPAGGTLVLDVDLGVGEAEVIVCGAGGTPCP